jgi:hypothetical protein
LLSFGSESLKICPFLMIELSYHYRRNLASHFFNYQKD